MLPELRPELFDAVLKFSASEGLCSMPVTVPPAIDPGLEVDDDLELESPIRNLSIAAIRTIVTVDTRAPTALPATSSGSSTSNAMELCRLKFTGEFRLLVLNREFLAVAGREDLPVSTGELLLVLFREFLAVFDREILGTFVQEVPFALIREGLLLFGRDGKLLVTGDVVRDGLLLCGRDGKLLVTGDVVRDGPLLCGREGTRLLTGDVGLVAS